MGEDHLDQVAVGENCHALARMLPSELLNGVDGAHLGGAQALAVGEAGATRIDLHDAPQFALRQLAQLGTLPRAVAHLANRFREDEVQVRMMSQHRLRRLYTTFQRAAVGGV